MPSPRGLWTRPAERLAQTPYRPFAPRAPNWRLVYDCYVYQLGLDTDALPPTGYFPCDVKDLACAVLSPGRISDVADILIPAWVEVFRCNIEDE